MRTLALIVGFAVTAVASAVGQWVATATTPTISHESGEARWSDWMESFAKERCPPTGTFVEGSDRDHFNCLAHNLWVRNDSSRPLQCLASFELTVANFDGKTSAAKLDIIYPGMTRMFVNSVGPTSSLPRSHSASCVSVPAEPPPLVVPANCRYEIKENLPLSEFYPRGAIRAKQEGTAEIEFVTRDEWRSMREPKLVRSSGFESLDRAALDYARMQLYRSNCAGQRFRHEVHFVLADAPPLPLPQTVK